MSVQARGEIFRDALIAIGFVALFLVGLGRPELMDPDESRHAEIARTMLAEGRFLTPRVYGEAYYDKPVGYHWTVAASLAFFGPTTAAARLPSALAALATLATTAWWALRIRDAAAARLAAVMLGTSLLFVALGRFGGIDMVFTALLTAAVARLSVAANEAAASRRSALVVYVLVALATLVKGPVALALVAPALVAAWITTREESAAWLVPWRGAATILAIAAPWYAAAAHADPLYIRTFLETHNLARFAGSEALAHQRSTLYYAIALPLACLPWTPLIAVGSYTRLRGGRWSASEVVLAVWLAAVLIVFALAGTRLVTYLLPAFPALAVLGAVGFVDMRSDVVAVERWRVRLRVWASFWGTVVAIAVAAATGLRIASHGMGTGATLTAILLLASVVAYGVAIRRSFGSISPQPALALLAAGTVLAAAAAYGPVADLLTRAKGYQALGSELARELPPDSVVLSLARAPHALSFYSGRTIGRVRDLDGARSAL
ncbi:MAG: glycosyltransferase family 39 protein, partial [Myxococcota bacterium]|nr:glycosyltransferase family 39 protein [Myxococcota bacterium]